MKMFKLTKGNLKPEHEPLAIKLYVEEKLSTECIAKIIGCGQKKVIAFIAAKGVERTREESYAATKSRRLKNFADVFREYGDKC